MEKRTSQKTKLVAWSERRGPRLCIGLLALAAAYAFASWAFNSGSLLDYAITLVLILFGVREIVIALQERK